MKKLRNTTQNNMLELLHYGFMQRAFIAGVITATVAPTIGIFFVVRRYSAMADTIAHLSLAGVAASLVLKTAAIPTALIFSILSVLGIERMREKRTLPSDTIVSLFLFGGLAVAVVLLGLAKGQNVNVMNYLFGNLVTVSQNDLWLISAIGLFTLACAAWLWPLLFAISLDEETAEAHGLPTRAVNRLLAVLGAATVAISMNVVGVLLIGALMVVPVLAAMKLNRGFFETWLAATICSVSSTIIGLVASYYLSLPSGGVIVLVALLFFVGTSIFVPRKTSHT